MDLPNPKSDELFFLPLGGSGEIGMNFNMYGSDGQWLIVDCGVTFGDSSYGSIDVSMPDIISIEKHKDKICGLLLTHAHEDHIGAVHYLWPYLKCPVYATDFAAEILRRKLSEVGLQDVVDIKIVNISSKYRIGVFNIEMISMTHSILEPASLLIETSAGKVFHTGDWKIDNNPQMGEGLDNKRLKNLSKQNVLAMVCDSTNIFLNGNSGSEEDVILPLTKIIKESKNKVLVSTFASNIVRLRTITKIGLSLGRKVALVGQSMWRMVDVAKQCGYLHDLPAFITEKDIKSVASDKLLIICTGSQGEERGALNRIANGNHKDISVNKGDKVVFSSRVIPGNEVAISLMQNKLSELGADIIESNEENLIHVSGHPAKDELSEMYSWVKPSTLIAVHGEARHINAHVKHAKEQQISNALPGKNGFLIKLSPGDPRYIGELESGRLVLDGNDLISRNSDVFKVRNKMMYNGTIFVVIILDKFFNLLKKPSVMIEGLIEVTEEEDPKNIIKDFLIKEIKIYSQTKNFDKEYITDTLTNSIKRFIKKEYSKRPVVKLEIVFN